MSIFDMNFWCPILMNSFVSELDKIEKVMLFLARMLLIRNCPVGKRNRIIQKGMKDCRESDEDYEMAMDQTIRQHQLLKAEDSFEPWIINLNKIEPWMMLVSSLGSDKFLKYVTGPKLIEELQSLMKLLEGDLESV